MKGSPPRVQAAPVRVNNTHSRTYAPRDRRCHDVVPMSPARPDEMAANRKSVYAGAVDGSRRGIHCMSQNGPARELIGSSRTFQRGNDSVCTDPSFTSVQVEPRLYNRKSFRPWLSAFFFPLCCNLFARMGNPATRAPPPRDASYDDREDWIPH